MLLPPERGNHTVRSRLQKISEIYLQVMDHKLVCSAVKNRDRIAEIAAASFTLTPLDAEILAVLLSLIR